MECYRKRFPGSYIQSPAKSVPVYWGHYSIVEAELLCLKDLFESGRNWSYAIDMAGSEVMMATNRELVDEISDKKGLIFTESRPIPESLDFRFKYQRHYDDSCQDKTYCEYSVRRWRKLGEHEPPPFNLNIYKGAKSWRLTRKFVNFLLHHPVAQTFLGIHFGIKIYLSILEQKVTHLNRP